MSELLEPVPSLQAASPASARTRTGRVRFMMAREREWERGAAARVGGRKERPERRRRDTAAGSLTNTAEKCRNSRPEREGARRRRAPARTAAESSQVDSGKGLVLSRARRVPLAVVRPRDRCYLP